MQVQFMAQEHFRAPKIWAERELISTAQVHLIVIRKLPASRSWGIASAMSNAESRRCRLFTYGTLKRGFANHNLMQDLIDHNDAVCLGYYSTQLSFPLVLGPYGIPYLINLPGFGRQIRGELYSVSDGGLARIDRLEGTGLGHYERLPVQVTAIKNVDGAVPIEAECYYAGRSFGEGLWNGKAREGLDEYTEREAVEYVKREDRPKDRSIFDDLQRFMSSVTKD